jgi:hypothetical protein
MPGKSASPDILLRPFRGPPRRSGRWGRPGIADRMEIPSWGREQHPPHTSPTIPAPARRDPPALPPLSGGFGPGAAPAGRQTLRQQFGERLDKLRVEERFNADDPVVGHVNQHVTGISEPATYATVTWPLKRLRRRVDGGALLHPAPAPVINPGDEGPAEPRPPGSARLNWNSGVPLRPNSLPKLAACCSGAARRRWQTRLMSCHEKRILLSIAGRRPSNQLWPVYGHLMSNWRRLRTFPSFPRFRARATRTPSEASITAC